MFPVTDFNFMVCGIATFAATAVGYAYTRKLGGSELSTEVNEAPGIVSESTPEKVDNQSSESSSQGEHSTASEPTSFMSTANVSLSGTLESTADVCAPIRKGSLKRKIPHDGFDAEPTSDLGYPYNLANIYPNKRSKTPTTDEKEQQAALSVPQEQPSSSIINMITDEDVMPMVSQEPEPIVTAEPIVVPEPVVAPEPIVAPTPIAASQPKSVITDLETPTTPPPLSGPSAGSGAFNSPSPLFAPSTPRPLTPRAFTPAALNASASRGFEAFAGSSSPFASTRISESSSKKDVRSIWATEDVKSSPFGTPNFSEKQKSHALTAAAAPAKTSTTAYLTGEENEDVELELKGVKLYVKRGDKPFMDGMIGHVKLLSDKTTLEERLLFRREPLWKVSMNVRITPTVRCNFDPDEHIVRLVLKESIETVSSKDCQSTELVIYALKPGRSCSKQDFREFAESLVASNHFKAPPAI